MPKDTKSNRSSIIPLAIASSVIVLFLSLAGVALTSVIYPDWFEGLRLSLASKLAQADVNQAMTNAEQLPEVQSELAAAVERLEAQSRLLEQSQAQIQQQSDQILNLESRIEELNILLKELQSRNADPPSPEAEPEKEKKEPLQYAFENVYGSIAKALSSGIKEINEQTTTLDKNQAIERQKRRLFEICEQFDAQKIRMDCVVQDKELFRNGLILLSLTPKEKESLREKSILVEHRLKVVVDAAQGERIKYLDSLVLDATISILFDFKDVGPQKNPANATRLFIVNVRAFERAWDPGSYTGYGHLFELKNVKILD
ncbi:hypothetical protein SH449x_001719 [Pirellulaceae bacterium SH449]